MTKAADRSSFQIYVTVKPRLYLCKNLVVYYLSETAGRNSPL